MIRTLAGTAVGIVAWILVASVINYAMRYGWRAYAAVERTYAWSLGMQFGRLANAAVASLVSGFLAARLAPGSRAPLFVGLVLLLVSLPIHYLEFDKMPLWYHAVYLLTLVPLVLAGARIASRPSTA